MRRFRTGLLTLTLGFLVTGTSSGQGAPALPGTLAYLQNQAVYVAPAAGRAARQVPRSKEASQVALSPAGGVLLFFVDGRDGASRGFVSRAPFTQSQPLPAPLYRISGPSVVWSPDGGIAYVSSSVNERRQQYAFMPADGRVRKESARVDAASRGGRVTARGDSDSVLLREAGRKEETVGSSAAPKPLLTAVRTARRAEKLKTLLEALEHPEESANIWGFSPPALTPDGQALFFASNLGAPMGAAGNTTYCFFVRNLAEKRLTALSGLGEFDGLRIPEVCSVSPDGKRLLFLTTAHSSAIWNRRNLYVVDLKTQKSRELLGPGYTRDDTNLVNGPPCWSPDGRYVATDVFAYRVNSETTKIRPHKPEGGLGKPVDFQEWDPSDRDYAVLIFDATTGREVRRIPHAMFPSWSR